MRCALPFSPFLLFSFSPFQGIDYENVQRFNVPTFQRSNIRLFRNSVGSLCDGGQPRRGDRCLAWGVSPRNSAFHFSSSREAATDAQLLTESEQFCRPLQGLML